MSGFISQAFRAFSDLDDSVSTPSVVIRPHFAKHEIFTTHKPTEYDDMLGTLSVPLAVGGRGGKPWHSTSVEEP